MHISMLSEVRIIIYLIDLNFKEFRFKIRKQFKNDEEKRIMSRDVNGSNHQKGTLSNSKRKNSIPLLDLK